MAALVDRNWAGELDVMNAQLVAIEGGLCGRAWEVTAEGITLGRHPASDVCLRDPLASRRHCRIYSHGGSVVVEDLGARNPVLVQGEPMREGSIRLGDIVSVGSEVFVLASLAAEPTGRDGGCLEETVSLEEYLSLHLPGEQTIRLDRDVRTVGQLGKLFEGAARMAACEECMELAQVAREALRQQFGPRAIWLCRAPHGHASLRYTEFLDDCSRPGSGLPGVVVDAMGKGDAVLLPALVSGRGGFLVAPLRVSTSVLGYVVLESGKAPYHSVDLRILQLFGMILATFMMSIQEHEQLRRDNEQLRLRANERLEFVGDSEVACAVRQEALRAARSDLNSFIVGETGTGKELIARTVHLHSARSSGPFVVVNCAAIPDELFESQLFGHARGAFTGAHASFEGLLSQADGGTLMLDEIGDLTLPSQARILRTIEYGTYRRLGEHEERSVNVRVLAATNRDVQAAIAKGEFREDLYHRLNGFVIMIPPLRTRKEDIGLLARHFLEIGRQQTYTPADDLEGDAYRYLEAQPWPGNVRELRNRVLRGLSLAEGSCLTVADVAGTVSASRPEQEHDETVTLKQAEKNHIERVLREHDRCVRTAAERLGVSRSTLYKKISDLGVQL